MYRLYFCRNKEKKILFKCFFSKMLCEMVFGDIFDEKYVAEDLEEWFDEIKTEITY